MQKGKLVWFGHATDGYKLGRVSDIGSGIVTVDPCDNSGQVFIEYLCSIL